MAIGASSTSIAFAARYASSVPWNSRCSLVTLVTIATRKRQLRTRDCASPWLVASITTLSLPASIISASSAWSSSASGVVLRSSFGRTSSPTRTATVPIIPGLRPPACSAATARKQVVVLPSVPVTPITSSRSDGRPYQASAASARASRVRSPGAVARPGPRSRARRPRLERHARRHRR